MTQLIEARAPVAIPRAEAGRQYDFDLHGFVGVRLLNAAPADIDTVTAQLGPIHRPLDRGPDIIIRFVEQIVTGGRMRIIGAADSAFDDRRFLILRGRGKSRVRVQVAFDEIGHGACEIVCERGVGSIPLLLSIINLTVLARGGLAIHASAVRYRGKGLLITGWSKGGKTETLLAFLETGAQYIGDEWIYLTPDGSTMFGVPEPVRVWDWQLDQLPHYRRTLTAGARVRLGMLRRLSGAARLVSRVTGGGATHRVHDLIERQRYAFLRPELAFKGGRRPMASGIDHVVFVANTESRAPTAERVSGLWVADRIAFSLQEERGPLLAAYRQFRFAFPDRANGIIDSAAELEAARLRTAFEGRDCHAVYHPYPPSIAELFGTIRPLLEEQAPCAS
jgi:hypothetical protein